MIATFDDAVRLPDSGASGGELGTSPGDIAEAAAAAKVQRYVNRLALAYLAFVTYGSLVPLVFVDRPMHLALNAFMPPPWLPIAAWDRADWIANLVLYVPLAFFALEAVCRDDAGARRVLRMTGVVSSILVLAVAIEFVQTFFAPRTVSLDDIVAEALGTVVGMALWAVAARQTRAAAVAALCDRGAALRLGAVALAGMYLLLALFPFDLVTSVSEFGARLRGPMAGWWVAGAACSGFGRCALHGAFEIAGGAAFGLALAVIGSSKGISSLGRIVFVAIAWGGGIELAQLFLISGISQGASAAARSLGIVAGYRVAASLPHVVDGLRSLRRSPRVLLAGWVVYVAALCVVNGAVRLRPAPMSEVARTFAELHWLPFYYHYFVSEQHALVSACVQLAMYAPVGVLVAFGAKDGSVHRHPELRSAAIAALLAAAVETIKLLTGKRADPTDLLLAASSGYFAFVLTAFALRSSAGASALGRTQPRRVDAGLFGFSTATIWATVLLLGAALALLRYPLPAIGLTLALSAYACLVLYRPNAWLLVIPALVPVLDLAPWTGWLFVDEIDLAVVATVSALSLRKPRGDASWPRGLLVLLALAIVCASVSFLRGLLPIDVFLRDMFWGQHYSTNALRPGKALLWAAILLGLRRRWSDGPERDFLALAKGMTVGLLAGGCIVVWEREAFAGLLNFDAQYRAVGAFSAASTAGAQIESFVGAALPFSAWLAARRGSPAWRFAGAAALMVGGYAVAATVSRTALAGAAAALLVFGAGTLVARRRHPIGAPIASRLPVPAVAITALCALVLAGYGIASRLASIPEDILARARHWSNVIAISDSTWSGALVGAGLGAYPARYWWDGPQKDRPALYSFREEKGRSFVRVAPGTPTFLNQSVPTGETSVFLRAQLRASMPGARVSFSLCAKWILYSTDCTRVSFVVERANQWQPVEAPLAWPASRRIGLVEAPVRLAINGGSVTSALDVTDVSLSSSGSADLLVNGSFEAGGSRWFLSADDHWGWNIFNIFVEVLFEQGWMGLVVFLIVLAYTVRALAQRVWHGDREAAAALAALAGFFVPAMFDSVIDDPRMRLLLWCLLLVPLLRGNRQPGSGEAPGPPSRERR